MRGPVRLGGPRNGGCACFCLRQKPNELHGFLFPLPKSQLPWMHQVWVRCFFVEHAKRCWEDP